MATHSVSGWISACVRIWKPIPRAPIKPSLIVSLGGMSLLAALTKEGFMEISPTPKENLLTSERNFLRLLMPLVYNRLIDQST